MYVSQARRLLTEEKMNVTNLLDMGVKPEKMNITTLLDMGVKPEKMNVTLLDMGVKPEKMNATQCDNLTLYGGDSQSHIFM